jgi:hypothetical protein
MSDETYKVEEFTRLQHNERVVVLQEGEAIPMAQAVAYGLVGGKKTDSGDGGEKPLDQLSGKEADAKAAALGVDPWDAKANVPAKRAALAEWVAAHPDSGDGGENA